MPTISTLSVDVVSNTSRFRTAMTGLLGGLTALAAGAAVAFHEFEESEKITAQTAAVIKSTGGAANVTAGQVDDLAQSIMNKTGIDDEAIKAGENLILTFKNIANEAGKGNDIFNQTTQVVTDMSVAMGQDFKSSAIQVGKALNDPIAGLTSLMRVGVQFTEEQKTQIAQFVKHNNLLGAQKIILQELTSEFGGSAEAQKTASQTMATALGNLAETVGGVLAPALTVLAEGLQTAVTWLQDHVAPAFDHVKETVLNAWNAVKPFAQTIANVLVPLLVTTWHTIQDRLLPVFERIKPLLIVIGGAIVLFATVVLAQFALMVTAVSVLIDKFLDLVGFIRDKVVEPIGNFLGRIVDFIGKIIGWVRDHLKPVWETTFQAIKTFIGWAITAMQKLINWIKTAISWLVQLGQGVSEALAQAGIQAGVFEGITVGGKGRAGGAPPHAQHGGLITKTGFAMVHKGEVFSGVNNEMGFGGITGDIVLNVNGQTLARITRDELLRLQKRNATAGIA